MLAKKFRIHTSVEFKTVMKDGQKTYLPGVKVFRLPNTVGHNRFGFIATKKVGNSVTRHRIARVLREVAKNNLEGGYDYVVLAMSDFDEKFVGEKLTRFFNAG